MQKPVWDDLDHLAGTWTKDEAKAFEKNTRFFEKIDRDLSTLITHPTSRGQETGSRKKY